jgi:hypothetical protein
MAKMPVKLRWYDRLGTPGALSHYQWVRQLPFQSRDRIAAFGCCTSEPLYLLWLLDASEVSVIELIPGNLDTLRRDITILTKTCPEALQGRLVKCHEALDMSHDVRTLPSDYFDLCYCDRVLYNMSPDLQKIQRAIIHMDRTAKPGGFIVAVEEAVVSTTLSQERKPVDITDLFHRAGLVPTWAPRMPCFSYCFRKPAPGMPRAQAPRILPS